MLRIIALRRVRAHKNVAQRRQNVNSADRNRVEELLLHLENNQIMPNNVETAQTHVFVIYLPSLCNIPFPMTRFTCIATSQVFVKTFMKSLQL